MLHFSVRTALTQRYTAFVYVLIGNGFYDLSQVVQITRYVIMREQQFE